MTEPIRGTRCAVCTMCGRCFEGAESDSRKWTGVRCDECVGCGKCLEAWGLSGEDDAESGPTNWADAFKSMDDGNRGAPPPAKMAPGVSN